MFAKTLSKTLPKKFIQRYSPLHRTLSLEEALAFLPDLRVWYLTGACSDRLLLRADRGILKTNDRALWLEEIIHDIAISIPQNQRSKFLDRKNALLNDIGL